MAEPFLGVALPDSYESEEKSPAGGGDVNTDGGAPAGAEPDAAGSEAPAGGDGFEVGNAQKVSNESKSSTETTKQAIADLLDLDKHERFRWQGRELTRKDLERGFMFQGDYTKKTQELSETRKYVDNFEVDLGKVIQNPELMDQFRKVYPASYVRMAERILERAGQSPTAPETQSGDKAATPDLKLVERLLEQKLAPMLDWKEQVQQSVQRAEMEKNLVWLDAQHDKLKTKYPFGSDKEVDFQMSAYLENLEREGKKGQITEQLMDALYKKSHEEREAQYKAHYKKQVEQQKAANSKAKDVGGGVSAEPKGVKKRTMAEAKKALFERFDA